MRAVCLSLILVLLTFALPSAWGQTDAELALNEARTSFTDGDFAKARDLLTRAAQTDGKNPDVFLLLGKSHFQLGQVEQAIAAWRQTLRLAPGQSYARNMLAALQGGVLQAETRIRIVRSLLKADLLDAAEAEIDSLRKQMLSPAQFVESLALEAEVLLRQGKPDRALHAVRELAIRDPGQADSARTRLLTGKAMLGLDDQSVARGMKVLQGVQKDFADAPQAAAAELALLEFRIRQGAQVVDGLAAWITAHGEHPEVRSARRAMVAAVGVFLEEAARTQPPTGDTGLIAADQAALAAALHALPTLFQSEEALQITKRISEHLSQRYLAQGAFATADSALAQLAAVDMLPASKTYLAAAREQVRIAAAKHEFQEIAAQLALDHRAIDDLGAWMAAHEEHPQFNEARRMLFEALLANANRSGPARAGDAINEGESAAIALAGQIIKDVPQDEKASVAKLLGHLDERYVKRAAYAPAEAGYDLLLKLDLTPSSRRLTLEALAAVKLQAALRRIRADVAAGRPQPRETPAELASALATLDSIQNQFPAHPVWKRRLDAADQLLKLAADEPWPAQVTRAKAIHEWVLKVVLPVAGADRGAELTDKAAAVVDAIAASVQAVPQPAAPRLAAQVHARLLEVLDEENASWPAVMLKQIRLEIADSLRVFEERHRTGRDAQNAALDEAQKRLLARVSRLLRVRPASADAALGVLASYLATWTAQGHADVAEQAYLLLTPDLPAEQRRQVRLATIRLWIDEVIRRDQRLLDRGFRPAQKLDDALGQALAGCYELQAALPESDGLAAEARQQRQRVIDHYTELKYFDIAAEAISAQADAAVAALDNQAELELAELHWKVAAAELDDQLEQFPGRERIAITPAVQAVIDELQAFIKQQPESPLVAQAADLMMSVGVKYEALKRHRVAADVYFSIEAFAAETPQLSDAPPDQSTVAERAAFAAANALHAAAANQWAQTQANNAEQAERQPPEQLSEAYQSALAAYQAILSKYSAEAAAGPAIGKIMEIALQHAQAGAWDVAAGVYKSLEDQELPLREPERLAIAQALCRLGEVLPDHSQRALAAIKLREPPAPVEEPPPADLQSAGGANGGALGGEFDPFQGARTPAAPEPPAADQSASAQAELPANQSAPSGESAEVRARRQVELLAAVKRQQAARTSRIAMLRDDAIQNLADQTGEEEARQTRQALHVPVLSEAEIQRRQAALQDAYDSFQGIREAYPESDSAEQARSEIMTIVDHWRSIRQWERAALLAKRYLTDNPDDRALPAVRLHIARDYLAWAASATEGKQNKQELLEQVGSRFDTAREELSGIIADFPDNQTLRHAAQWDVANSHLTQARVVAGFSRTLARGQFVRATNELLRTAELYHRHPNIGKLPEMLWNISEELTSRGFFNEAITVWNKMTLRYPGNLLAEQAALRIAETYRRQLRQPLRAAESYLELNFARGGDQALQDAIFQIASQLASEKRWVEALHVLGTFVDSFPKHAHAGQAVAMIGQVHQTNEVWEDAINAYRRVILGYDQGPWAQQSKWAIAECTINLSRWEEAQDLYRDYQRDYPEDEKVAEATRRLEVLKDLARYQKVVDEPGQRKAFDAQYQIATIVRKQLTNPVKAIIEYRKVAANWPESHLADDALFQVGMIYLELHETDKAREALLATAEKHPASPLADDALFQVGASYENDAQQLAGVTRGQSIQIAKDIAQKKAYRMSQSQRRTQRAMVSDEISKLREEGRKLEAENKSAFRAARNLDFDRANAAVVAKWAAQQEEALTTAQLADRQDKINASLRQAVAMFRRAASVASADKADDALLRMAQIYDQRLKDSDAAMSTWLEIVEQYSGTTVAEDASWKIARYYESHEKHAEAITAYKSFLRNYRRSPKASAAQAAIAENHEHLGNWVEAMDAYTNYINNFPQGDMVDKAKEQIAWIKTYRL